MYISTQASNIVIAYAQLGQPCNGNQADCSPMGHFQRVSPPAR